MGNSRWFLPGPDVHEAAAALSSEAGLSLACATVLAGRGIVQPAEARTFLRPLMDHLHDPFALPDMRVAINRLNRAIDDSETILVHGDYDADGMSATALVALGLRRVGAHPVPFVPHRTRDGYDFGASGIARAKEVGASVVVTVDCGIRAVQAVKRASSLGIDVVITDHHRVGPELPEAVAVVNPMRSDSEYPFRDLAGVGVAFKLIGALFETRGIAAGELNQHLDLVSIGTVADQMPLQDENRSLVRAGGRVLAKTLKPGLRALMRRADITAGSEVTAEDIAFRVAPRLNSAGRIAEPEAGLSLLTTNVPAEAEALADALEELNAARRSEDRVVTDQVTRLLESSFRPETEAVAVAWGDGWHPGVVGIAASRAVDRWQRPAVVVAFEGDIGTGSGRSVAGFHLLEGLRQCDDLLERYGGHKLAAGFTVLRENMEPLAARLRSLSGPKFAPGLEGAALVVDLESAVSQLSLELYDDLARLRPFGAGNETPVLMTRDVRATRISAVGAGSEHLRCALASGTDTIDGIGFHLGDRLHELQALDRIDVAFHLVADTWRGRRRVQARLLDFRPASVP